MSIRKIRHRLHSHICSDILVGIKDGVNRVFSLSYTPLYPEVVELFLNGLLMTLGEDKDFTLIYKSKILTFNIKQIPQFNDNIVAFYLTK